jgi:hypothetical protein
MTQKPKKIFPPFFVIMSSRKARKARDDDFNYHSSSDESDNELLLEEQTRVRALAQAKQLRQNAALRKTTKPVKQFPTLSPVASKAQTMKQLAADRKKKYKFVRILGICFLHF